MLVWTSSHRKPLRRRASTKCGLQQNKLHTCGEDISRNVEEKEQHKEKMIELAGSWRVTVQPAFNLIYSGASIGWRNLFRREDLENMWYWVLLSLQTLRRSWRRWIHVCVCASSSVPGIINQRRWVVCHLFSFRSSTLRYNPFLLSQYSPGVGWEISFFPPNKCQQRKAVFCIKTKHATLSLSRADRVLSA